MALLGGGTGGKEMMMPSECFTDRQGHTSGFTTALPLLDTIPDTAHSKSPTTGS